MEAVLVALNDLNQSVKSELVQERKQSIGLVHQKMQKRYKVVQQLPKKADSLENLFNYADAYGTIRFGYFGSRFKEESVDLQNSFASAFGGILGIKTASYKGVSFNVATYVSQDLPFFYDDAKRSNDFYTNEGKSYAYLAEASLNYSSEFLEAKVGRFVVDMPYANSDDIRMSQNSFEGAWGAVHFSEHLTSQLFFLQRWAGFDSQDETASQNEFKKLVADGYGMVGASLSYAYNEESEANLWVHHIDKMANVFYAEINGVYNFDANTHFDYGLQIASIDELSDSNVDGEVYGAMFIAHKDAYFVGVSGNWAVVEDEKFVTDGFGGGPYYTSLDEATIAYASETSPGKDISMYRTSCGVDVERIASSFEYTYGYMTNSDNWIKEHDLIYTFEYEKSWQIQAVAANFSMKKSENRLSRFVMRIDYRF